MNTIPMTVEQWQRLTPEQKKETWPKVAQADRDAIMLADRYPVKQRTADAISPAPYKTPATCAVLYLSAAGSAIGAVVLFFIGARVSGIVCLASAFSFVIWGQMLNHIAQAAFYTRRTAELLERRC
jgi:hypothetical protein